MNNDKLYFVTLRGGGNRYKTSYVIAKDPEEAYQKVKEFLDENDLCFTNDRELSTISLLAEATDYPRCEQILFV